MSYTTIKGRERTKERRNARVMLYCCSLSLCRGGHCIFDGTSAQQQIIRPIRTAISPLHGSLLRMRTEQGTLKCSMLYAWRSLQANLTPVLCKVLHRAHGHEEYVSTDLGSALLPRGPGETRMRAMSARLSLMWPEAPMSLNTLFLSLSCPSPICSQHLIRQPSNHVHSPAR